MRTEKIKSIRKIGFEETSDLIVEKNHNFFANDFLVHNSGYGKGLTSEGLLEWYHKKGYIVFCIADPKFENELAFQMFEPREKYHLSHLNMIARFVGKWKLPSRRNLILYHPYSKDIPTERKLPKMKIFTIPIKELGRPEWSLLSEIHGTNETVSNLLKASQEISNEDGIYSFVHYVQNSINKKGKKNKADWKNFGLEASSGTMKEVSKISNVLTPFKRHPFLTKQNSEFNLNWKEILQDQKNYHIFLNHHIGRNDEKLTDFLVLYLLESILKNKKYLKDPVIIYLPEIDKLCEYHPEGHKQFLSEYIKKDMKTMRSEGKGVTTLSDTHNFKGLDEEVSGSSTVQIIGELGDIKDVENVCKALGLGRSIKEQLSKANIPRTYLVRGVEEGSMEDGGYLFFYPSAMHCEPHYNFEEMYGEHHQKEPEKYPLVSYREISDKIKRYLKDDEMKMRKKVEKREKEEEAEEKRKQEEKESKKQENETKESRKEKETTEKDKDKKKWMKLCYERFMDESLDKKERGYRAIARYLNFPESSGHKTVKKYIEEYEKIIKEDESLDYEERFSKMMKNNQDLN